MATNYIQQGDILDLTVADKKSGDPVAVGEIVGVALNDTDDDGEVRVKTSGVFNLAVTGKDASNTNVAVNIGDAIYYDNGVLNKDATNGVLFGYALGAVAAGATATIPVKIAAK